MIKNPKVVVIGAGSLFFGRQAIWQMVHSPYLNKGILALVDTDEEVLNKMAAVARMVVKEQKVELKIEASTDRREVLKDADFVILTFAKDSIYYRGIDCEVSEEYGVRMCSGDTIGPGGILRSMRELPVILKCVGDIRKLCPNAFVINYINPTAVNGIAIQKYAPELKSFALCDGNHMPFAKIRYAVRAGIIKDESEYSEEIDRDFDIRIAGVNHFTWIIKAAYQGKDVLDTIADAIHNRSAKETDGGDKGAKAILNEEIGYQLYKAFGAIPTAVSHAKEYVRFWQGKNVALSDIPPLSIWETEPRYRRRDQMFQEMDGFLSGDIPASRFMEMYTGDHATDVIENIVGNLGKQYYINTTNNGAVTNMNDDAFLELLCDVDINGVRPVHVGALPAGIRGMEEVVLDTHVLTAEGIINKDISIIRRAFLTDPLICSIEDADAILNELLEREKDVLDSAFYTANK